MVETGANKIHSLGMNIKQLSTNWIIDHQKVMSKHELKNINNQIIRLHKIISHLSKRIMMTNFQSHFLTTFLPSHPL
jgi:flagellar biosynthesis chaperone FliJ